MICEKCGKEFFEDYRVDKGWRSKTISRFCSRACANSRTFSKESNQKKAESILKTLEAKGWAEKIKLCRGCGCKINFRSTTGFCKNCKETSEVYKQEHHLKLSKAAKGNGGYRLHSGRGKHGTYKGYRCDSSWELAYVVYNLEHNIPFIRNTEAFEYEFESKKHKYYPDFIEGDTYVEIKGYFQESVKAKTEQFPKKLKVLYLKDMQKYLDYTKEKYGDKFWEVLYEDVPKKDRLKCEFCGKDFQNPRSCSTHRSRCKSNPSYRFWSIKNKT